ncbi:monoacylglycerol lipase ABHD12-like [Mizuhopecten yessoensis]|uniref:Monoacylglycerol lipase ABHD12 n=1 Tax=Mizuhopecten yessoensis TaxID=6573 RepID=A0A210QYK8_MIZYE|nr:monoacylglycerol lipase ABHD12-like [Mizuhopecten yessoensis]OWF53751.1 Monoacylglycerol lipase ABHD12 [Mizuhopecten yessoensis]
MSNTRQRKSTPVKAQTTPQKEEEVPVLNTDTVKGSGQALPGWLWRAILLCVKVTLGFLFCLHVLTPVFILTNPWIQSKAVFLNNFRWPPFIDVTKPEEFGLGNTVRNFYLQVEEHSRVGVWHLLPQSLAESGVEFNQYESLLKDGKPIFLYLHGTSGSRAGWHRVQLYKLLVSLEFHVIAFDYRGWADSVGEPTEDGVVADSYFIYKWIKQRSGNAPVFLWGHSLGTAITTKLAKMLCEKGEEPVGVVLESPFTNIKEAASKHPFTAPFRMLPWFEAVFLDTIDQNNISFTSDKNIAHVTTPLLILHAEDDKVVPFELGKKLYSIASETRPTNSGPLEFVSFNASYGYGHKLICMAPELPLIIRKFLETCHEEGKHSPQEML